jgi:molecular chaperone Hsp33
MLLSMGRAEVDDIIAEQGQVEVTCDFCNARQTFDAVDVGQLFATGQTQGADTERPH